MKYVCMSLILVTICASCFGQGDADQLVPVVHESSTQKVMTKQNLDRIIRGENQRWANGDRIKLLLPVENEPGYDAFVTRYYNTNAKGLDMFWRSQLFRNQISRIPSKTKSTVSLSMIKKRPGTLGFIPRNMIEPGVVEVKIR